eukprot:753434-Hanusia_phi.AAC.1
MDQFNPFEMGQRLAEALLVSSSSTSTTSSSSATTTASSSPNLVNMVLTWLQVEVDPDAIAQERSVSQRVAPFVRPCSEAASLPGGLHYYR